MRGGGISGCLISQVLEDPAVTIQFIVSGLQPGHEYERLCAAGGCLVLDQDSKTTHGRYIPVQAHLTFVFFYLLVITRIMLLRSRTPGIHYVIFGLLNIPVVTTFVAAQLFVPLQFQS